MANRCVKQNVRESPTLGGNDAANVRHEAPIIVASRPCQRAMVIAAILNAMYGLDIYRIYQYGLTNGAMGATYHQPSLIYHILLKYSYKA